MKLFSNKQAYVSLLYCRAEMYAGRVACCPLVRPIKVRKKMGQTDERTLHCYITLTARRGQNDNRT